MKKYTLAVPLDFVDRFIYFFKFPTEFTRVAFRIRVHVRVWRRRDNLTYARRVSGWQAIYSDSGGHSMSNMRFKYRPTKRVPLSGNLVCR